MDIAELVNKFGFPVIAAGGMGYIIYTIWIWATVEIKPVLSEANTTLIALIDRIRMLDNDLIRLNQKLNIVLQLRGKQIESDRHLEDVKTSAEAQKKELEAAAQQRKAAEELAHQHTIDVQPNGTVSVTDKHGDETVKVNVLPQENKEKINEPNNRSPSKGRRSRKTDAGKPAEVRGSDS
jgi:hypothetical protein